MCTLTTLSFSIYINSIVLKLQYLFSLIEINNSEFRSRVNVPVNEPIKQMINEAVETPIEARTTGTTSFSQIIG